MYNYLTDEAEKEFLRKAKSKCSNLMQELEKLLRFKYKIRTQFFLVGSGGKNMVTKNSDGAIDFDYNLNVYDGFNSNGKEIREKVRFAFNEIMRKNKLPDVEDSTRSLTTKLMSFNSNKFSMDVCIVTNKNGRWYRLKHIKTGNTHNDRYIWEEIPDSDKCSQRAQTIKKYPGWWEEVRKHYLELKNKYLSKNDNKHPSIVCYYQAVNDVYNDMNQKGIIKHKNE